MTAEERLDRIEHVTAMLVEERRTHREEYKQLWRDTNRQIADVWKAIDANRAQMIEMATDFNQRMDRMAVEFDRRMERSAAEFNRRLDTLDERIRGMAFGIA